MNLSDIQSEIIDLSDTLCRLAVYPTIRIVFKDVVSYRAKAFLPGLKNGGEGFIAVSNNLLLDNRSFREAVVIHEVCHFLYWRWCRTSDDFPATGYMNHHGPRFKQVETKWLKEFGMYPLYAKAYWHTLLSAGDEILWSKRKSP